MIRFQLLDENTEEMLSEVSVEATVLPVYIKDTKLPLLSIVGPDVPCGFNQEDVPQLLGEIARLEEAHPEKEAWRRIMTQLNRLGHGDCFLWVTPF